MSATATLFVFVDAGAAGLKRIAAHRLHRRHTWRRSSRPAEPGPIEARLKQLVDTYQPKTIGLAIGGTRGMTRSLTHDTLP